ncbi:hypothetical protein FVER53590_29014 [Fusarium verticillioides]|nr:hypothetical protein FVER53590_29014 [Fusarium verticillioides]
MDQNNNRRIYRPLVSRDKAPVFAPPPRVDIPKRKVTSVACESCRRRKIKHVFDGSSRSIIWGASDCSGP